MRIDLQIPAHFRQQVGADLFVSILEGREFFTEIQTPMASFSLIGDKVTGDLLATGDLPHAALDSAPFIASSSDIYVR
ncbi:MAG: hypothetical protein ACR2NN_22105 [Bryobacteraceae bacterium]